MKSIVHAVLLSSLLILSIQSVSAKDDALLDALHSEAENTSMEEDKTLENTVSEPSIIPKDIIDYDELEKKIAKQIKSLLKEPVKNDDKKKSDKKFTDKLENIVSSALLQGNKMDDIRSAVSAAMINIRKSSAKVGDVSTEVIESADKALKDIVAEKKVNTLKNISGTTQAGVAISRNTIVIANTVTVLEGESLYKIAQRVYGSGSKYLELYKANKDVLSNPDMIRVGQILKVP
jgi:nucleoid-associated protein YgaU